MKRMRGDVFTLAKESADLAFDMSPCHSEERERCPLQPRVSVDSK